MSQLLADLRYALRSLRRVPLFTTVAVLSMAFGIAANTAVFTLLDQVILRRLPVPRPAELVQVHARGMENFGGGMGDGSELSYPMYRDLRDQNEVFAGLFCRAQTSLHVGYDGTHRPGLRASSSPARSSRCSACVLRSGGSSRRTTNGRRAGIRWRCSGSRTGGRASTAIPEIVGRTITVNGQPLEVVGVVQQGFEGLDIGQPAQVYVPVSMQPKMGPAWLQLEGRRFRWVQVYGRLRAGMTAGDGAGRHPASLPRAAAAGVNGRQLHAGIARHEAAVPRRRADRRGRVPRPFIAARLRDRAADHPDGARRRRAVDRLRERVATSSSRAAPRGSASWRCGSPSARRGGRSCGCCSSRASCSRPSAPSPG